MLGYIFDINGSILSDNEIELLRHGPNDDEIGDAIRIAHSNVLSFMDYLGIRRQQKKISISILLYLIQIAKQMKMMN